jgi:Holliday junction resolvase
MKKINIIKASGTQEPFSSEKLKHSLSKSGANEATIENILIEIESKLYDGISTKKIYQAAFNMLKRGTRSNAGRYNLKRAIMALGPSGFPFEKYIAAIFEWQGYKVQTQLFLQGACVTHEIDVLAENETEHLLIECKYHNSVGIVSDVKIPLYIHSRYKDVLKNWAKTHTTKPLNCCVVTNTKFSSDAVKYGACIGLRLLGWDYPNKKSLSSLIDKSGLYPITCLTTLTNKEKEIILENGIVLCTALLQHKNVLHLSGISQSRIDSIIAEARTLIKF